MYECIYTCIFTITCVCMWICVLIPPGGAVLIDDEDSASLVVTSALGRSFTIVWVSV